MDKTLLGDVKRACLSALAIAISGFLIFRIDMKTPVTINKAKRPKPENKEVWIEYDGFLGNPVTDGRWVHWSHKPYKYATNYNEPPSNVPIRTFPQLGLYSSHDPSTIRRHLYEISSIGIDAVILQWWPPNRLDENEDDENANFTDTTLKLMLQEASEFNIKIGVQIQIYQDRSSNSIYDDISYLMETYGSDDNFLKVDGSPVVIIYDPHEIHNLYTAMDNITKRFGNCYFIANVLEKHHIGSAVEDGFSAVFSYFASESGSWCSNISNWKMITADSKERRIRFFPTVGPGYNDDRLNRWRNDQKRSRESGRYYDRMWKAAVSVKPKVVIINSFNNWFDGTHIEHAIDKKGFEFDAECWSGAGSESSAFMKQTMKWIDYFKGFASLESLSA